MNHSIVRIAVLVALIVAVVACSNNDTSESTGDSSLSDGGDVTPGIADNTSVSSTVSLAYDSNRAMWDIFSWPAVASAEKGRALLEIARMGDRNMVLPLVEALRYMPSGALREQVATALREVTEQSYTDDDWEGWTEWLGRNRESHEPPPEYVKWKIDLMVGLDSRFLEFLTPALKYSPIDLPEVVWGGMGPKDSPDLTSPLIVPATEAVYFDADDRVFGVTIEGESRAYPLRIVNAHEIVNYVVGGEPISLMW